MIGQAAKEIFLDGGNNSFPNGGNLFILFFYIEWRQPSNLEKQPLMDIQFYLNPYVNSNGFFICTNSPIIWEDLIEQYSLSLEQYWRSYKYIVLEIKSIRKSILWVVLSTFPTYKFTGVYSYLFYFIYSDDRFFLFRQNI